MQIEKIDGDLQFEVLDEDPRKNDLIGQCSVSMRELIEKRKDKYVLMTKNGKNAGQLLIEAIFNQEAKEVQKPTVTHKFEKI